MGRNGWQAAAVANSNDADCASLPGSPEEYFEQRFRNMVGPGDFVLDAGCSRGKYSPRVNSDHYKVAGVDNFESVRQNSSLDYRICGNVNKLPFADASFDLVYARWLVEHLENPVMAFGEFHRVLKPG